MNLDVFTLSALVDEFLDTLAGGHIQDVLDVDETGIGLEIYADHKRRYLYMSADTQTPRVHIVPDKLRRGLVKPTQLGLLMRRFVEGGIVAHVSQPAWERLLHIEIEGPEGEVTLIIEPMERRSNLLLVQNGIVLDCMRRVGAKENRVRVSLPGQPYVPPPAQLGKVDPRTLTLEIITQMLRDSDEAKRKAHQALSAHLYGFSPLLGREVIYQATGESETRARDADAGRVFDAAQRVLAPLLRRDWQPGIAINEQGVTAFSAYPLTVFPGWQPVETMSEALTGYYSAPVGVDAYKSGKTPTSAAIADAQGKLRGRLASLQRSMTDESEREILKQSGELILAYQYALAPGEIELRAQYDADAPDVVIALDPKMSALENAQRYFDRYNRAKRALDDVPTLIAETQNELAYLDQLATDLELANNYPEIDEVQAALQSKGYWRGASPARSTGQKSAPLRVVTRDGFVIWVGRNSRQNEQVTFDKGSPQDLWLHARDVPGAHVIIKMDGRPAPEPVIDQAAALAAYYSARRNDAKVPVDVTSRRQVRKIKGAAPGLVTYRGEETRLVTPRGEPIESV